MMLTVNPQYREAVCKNLSEQFGEVMGRLQQIESTLPSTDVTYLVYVILVRWDSRERIFQALASKKKNYLEQLILDACGITERYKTN